METQKYQIQEIAIILDHCEYDSHIINLLLGTYIMNSQNEAEVTRKEYTVEGLKSGIVMIYRLRLDESVFYLDGKVTPDPNGDDTFTKTYFDIRFADDIKPAKKILTTHKKKNGKFDYNMSDEYVYAAKHIPGELDDTDTLIVVRMKK